MLVNRTCLNGEFDANLECIEFHKRSKTAHSTSTFELLCQFDELVLTNEEDISVPEEVVAPSDDRTTGSNRILA